jgi:hypothetical protein
LILKEYSLDIFLDGLSEDQLSDEIYSANCVSNFEGISRTNTHLQVIGDSMDETALDLVINSHELNPIPIFLTKTVYESKAFSDDLMQRLKVKNILEGLASIDQAAWVHHRLRKTQFTLSDETTVVDIDVMNLVISGDMETAEFVLGQMTADDMTKSYHWLSQERIDWIRNEIRTYLGWPPL